MSPPGHRLTPIRPLSWSPVTESNRRPSPYHGDALPTELTGPVFSCLAWGFGRYRGPARAVPPGPPAPGPAPRAARATRAGAARAGPARAGAAGAAAARAGAGTRSGRG